MEKKTKVIIECTDGEVKTYEGQSAIGFVIDEADEGTGICQTFLVGEGDKSIDLIKAAMALGALAKETMKDKTVSAILVGVMAKIMIDAASGDIDFLKSTVTKAAFEEET